MISYIFFLMLLLDTLAFLEVTAISFAFQSQTFHAVGASVMPLFVQLLPYHSTGHHIWGFVSPVSPVCAMTLGGQSSEADSS